MTYNILLTAPYMLPFVEKFKSVFNHYDIELIIPAVEERMEEADILAYAGKFDGTICGDDRYTKNVLEACSPRLKVVSKWGTGIDSIDQKSCQSLGIMIGNAPNAFTYPVADTIMGYTLAFARRQPWMDAAMKSGEWEKISGHSLMEVTIGLIGLGNIGRAVAKRALGFDMKCIATDIIDIPKEITEKLNVSMVTKEELFTQADYICLTCDLNPTSHQIINQESIALMKPPTVIINVARGPLVDEKALITALSTKKIRGAALDVFEYEPLPEDNPLKKMDNVMLAPHNANSSPVAWEKVHWISIKNLLIGLDISYEDLGPHLIK
jgi:D-3-phosphoglycerate dehydrogenase / 2-oxoglutarate reductase